MKKRILSLLLCCCLLAGVFQPQKARAVFVADDLAAAGGVALVASLLVAGGAAFRSNEDLQAVAQDIYDRYIQPSSALLSEVTGLVRAWYKGVGSGVVCCANISTRLWNAVCGDPVAENVASGNYGAGRSFTFTSKAGPDGYWSWRSNNFFSSLRADGHVFSTYYSDSTQYVYFCVDGVVKGTRYVAKDTMHKRDDDRYPGGVSCYIWLSVYDTYAAVEPNWFGGGSYQLSYPFTISYGASISYPTDKDLIRPGEKSAVVQLPSDLPRYGEDGATVEMPVLGLTQEDYLITGSDVLSPDKVDEDVILDVKTGTKVGTDTGEVTDPTTPIAGNILDWLKSVLKGLLDAIISLLTAIRDGILSIPQAIAKAVAAVFTPSDEALQALQSDVATKFAFVTDLRGIVTNFGDLLQHPDQAASGLALTTIVDLGKHTGGGWGDAKINLLDASWFLQYKSLTDDIVVGLAWLVFIWNLYGQLPSIIHGMSSGDGVSSKEDGYDS